MSKLIPAAQLYTLREQMKTPEDIETGLRKVREIGYTSVQVSGIGPIDRKELRRICDELGLSVCATHVPLQDILNETERVAEEHKIMGCPLVGIGSGGELVICEDPSADKYHRVAELLNQAGEKLRAHGLAFAYHNHNAEFHRLETGETGMDILLRETNPETVGFILDTYWVQAGGASPIEYIRRLEGRIKVIHFKDMDVDKKRNAQMAAVGEGNFNWHDIIAACEETGVETAAVEQDICPRDPFDCLRASYNYLTRECGLK